MDSANLLDHKTFKLRFFLYTMVGTAVSPKNVLEAFLKQPREARKVKLTPVAGKEIILHGGIKTLCLLEMLEGTPHTIAYFIQKAEDLIGKPLTDRDGKCTFYSDLKNLKDAGIVEIDEKDATPFCGADSNPISRGRYDNIKRLTYDEPSPYIKIQ